MKTPPKKRIGAAGSRSTKRPANQNLASPTLDIPRPIGSDPNAPLYRIPAVVGMTGLSRSVVYRLINEGRLKKINLGRASMVCGDSLRALVAELRAA